MMSEMTYRQVDELIEKRLKPVVDGINKLSETQNEGISKLNDTHTDVLKELLEINGSVKAHHTAIQNMRKDLDAELEESRKCPVRTMMVDVVVVEKETRWSRWLGKNRSFILIIIMLIALLSGFPNWMRFFGVESPWTQDPDPVIYIYEGP